MPRRAGADSCLTCRRRKLRCDEGIPTCLRCQKARLRCEKVEPKLEIKQYKVPVQHEIEDDWPRHALQQPDVAEQFRVYIQELAPWYDLNDAGCTFAKKGAKRALDSPLLFAAAIALSALYSSRKANSPTTRRLADDYHDRCLKHLIRIKSTDAAVRDGTALCATCLLRSYEILAEEKDPNRHLFGASTLLPPQPPGFGERTLMATGFWNFLREDITYSLIHKCPLKIQIQRMPLATRYTAQEDMANAVTLILGRAVNWYFSSSSEVEVGAEVYRALVEDLAAWRNLFTEKPYTSSRDETTTFPRVQMFEDNHVAGMHYFHVTRCILSDRDSEREDAAEQVCGLAIFSDSDPVAVNAYGPTCFTGRWLRMDIQRQHLIRWLKASQQTTAWSVEQVVERLQSAWSSTRPWQL